MRETMVPDDAHMKKVDRRFFHPIPLNFPSGLIPDCFEEV